MGRFLLFEGEDLIARFRPHPLGYVARYVEALVWLAFGAAGWWVAQRVGAGACARRSLVVSDPCGPFGARRLGARAALGSTLGMAGSRMDPARGGWRAECLAVGLLGAGSVAASALCNDATRRGAR